MSNGENNVYGIDCLNLDQAGDENESDLDWLHTGGRGYDKDPKIIRNNKCLKEWYILNYLWNPTKCNNNTSSFSTIMNVCMNIYRDKTKFRNFCIFLESGFNPTIFTMRIQSKLKHKNKTTTKQKTQPGTFGTTKNLNVNFCLP